MSHCQSSDNCGCGTQDESLDAALERIANAEALQRIRHKIVVLSGKGGVGKSSVAVNLAVALAMAGRQVGLLDVDLHGPSIPTMLRLEHDVAYTPDGKLKPVGYDLLKVMSVGLLLETPDTPVIWRGPAKAGVIGQFVTDVAWGELDYLIVDCPPGTGDEPLSIIQALQQVDGAVVVTTPQAVALTDVRKSIRFCQSLQVPVLGVVENMSGLVCPHCQGVVDLFSTGGGEAMAAEMSVPFLGRIPLDPQMVTTGDQGKPLVHAHAHSPTAVVLTEIAMRLLDTCETTEEPAMATAQRIAIPIAEGQLCLHFGHCEQFAMVDIDPATQQVLQTQYLTPPPHEPGVIPRWLHEQGATTIIAGGMGSRAQGLFAQNGITVVTGAPAGTPEALVAAYLQGTLVTGDNVCDH